MERTKCLIIGSGPAGFTAAIYASRANLAPLLYEGPQSGGQLITTTVVENFPGYPEGVSGYDMMEDMRNQALKFDTTIRTGMVTAVDFGSTPYTVTIDDSNKIIADTIIIATGVSAKYLGLPDETKYAGRGVSTCATCDGFFFRKKTVAVVGGGDTACEEAAFLSTLADKVYLIVRKNYLRASDIMQKRVLDNPKIEVLFGHNAVGLTGENRVEGVRLVKDLGLETEKHYERAIDGFFLAIGHKPNSDIFKPWIETDENGYIKTKAGTPVTNIPGVFAAGDVADPIYRQAVCAAGSGCKAAIEAERYLNR